MNKTLSVLRIKLAEVATNLRAAGFQPTNDNDFDVVNEWFKDNFVAVLDSFKV